MRKAQIITHKVWSRNKNLGRDLHRWCWSWRGLYLFNTNSRLQQSELSLSLYLCVLEAVFDGLKIPVCSLAKSICLGGMASFHCKQRVLEENGSWVIQDDCCTYCWRVFSVSIVGIFTTKWKSWSTCLQKESKFRVTQRSSSESHHLEWSWRCVLDHVSCQSSHLQSWLGMPYIHGMWGSLEKSDQENEGSQPKPGLHNHHLVFIQCLPSKTFSTSCLSCFSFLVLLRRLEPLFFWRVLTSFGRASCKHISFLCATCHGGF